MQRQISILGLMVFLSSSDLLAAETAKTTVKYTLETLVEKALSRSDQIVSQQARIGEKDEAASQSAAWQNPNFEVQGGVRMTAPDVGPVFRATLSQLFYFPGKQELRKEVAGYEKTLEEIKLAEAELAITVDVVRLAYEYAVNQRKAQFAQKRRKRFELIRGYLAGHTFASPQQKTTSIVVKQRLKGIAADEMQLQGALQATLKQLNFYLGDSNGIPEISVPWLNGERLPDEKDWLERALANNIELAGQRVLVSQATKEKELLAKEVLPDFTVSAFYGQETAGQTDRVVGVGLSIPLPIWNQNRAGIRSKEQKIKAEQYELSLKEKKIAALVQKFTAEYEANQKIVREYSEAAVGALESQLRSMEQEFRKSRLDFLLFLEMDIQTADTANRMFNAQLSLLDNIASLHFLARDKNLISELSNF